MKTAFFVLCLFAVVTVGVGAFKLYMLGLPNVCQ